jgi:NTE family protein
VLQGGGALGAYEWGAITALLELMDAAEQQGRQITLKAVSGVSIGAVNADCVVGSQSRADAHARLDALWNDLMLNVPELWSAVPWNASVLGLPKINLPRDLALFGLPGFYFPRPDLINFAKWTSYTIQDRSSRRSSATSISTHSMQARPGSSSPRSMSTPAC